MPGFWSQSSSSSSYTAFVLDIECLDSGLGFFVERLKDIEDNRPKAESKKIDAMKIISTLFQRKMTSRKISMKTADTDRYAELLPRPKDQKENPTRNMSRKNTDD